MLEQLQQKYLASFADKIVALKTALEQDDVQALNVQLHQLAGSSGSYGYAKISELCTEIENLILNMVEINPTITAKTTQLVSLLEQHKTN